MLAGAMAALLLSGCTVAVDDWQESVGDLPVYPGAKALTAPAPAIAGVSFTGSFADTTTDGSQFATEDDVDLVLQFYRDAMRSYGRRFECRGAVNVQARGRTEELRCIPSGASDSVQIAASVPGRHAIVRVTPAVNGATFTLLNVRTRH
jgi:hypothetical protein